MQVGTALLVWRLDGEAGQAFQPELPRRRHLVALLGKDNREEARRQGIITTYLGRNAPEQACLPTATWADHELMWVRVAGAVAQHLDERGKFARPDTE